MARVLIVDDDEDVRDAVAAVLRREGHDVDMAADGAAGLEALARRLPDLVLVDVTMPNMSGHELTREIRRRHGDALPVVMLSGAPEERVRAAAGEGRVHGWVGKPFELEELTSTVTRILRSTC